MHKPLLGSSAMECPAKPWLSSPWSSSGSANPAAGGGFTKDVQRTVANSGNHTMEGTDPARTFNVNLGSVEEVLDALLQSAVILDDDWQALPADVQAEITASSGLTDLLKRLVARRLINEFQASQIAMGRSSMLEVGAYRLIDFIGSGSGGRVYRARHSLTLQPAAIKLLQRDNPPITEMERRRFYNEIRVAAPLQHPNIVRILDAGELPPDAWTTSATPYYVMEYVGGETLDALVNRRGRLPVRLACSLGYQIASALSEIHRRRLVHRDVKPANVMVADDDRAKLFDFGVALCSQDRLTLAGSVVGTVDFLAPEQAFDSASVSIAADIYGLGGILFWCLTGQAPFASAGNLFEAIVRRQKQPPPSVRAVFPDVPPALDAVIRKMLETQPRDRFATPEEVMQRLLPFSADAAAPWTVCRDPETQNATVQESVRVLVVDSDPLARGQLTSILSRQNADCEEAATAADAAGMLGSEAYDLIVADWGGDAFAGIELVRRLRSEGARDAVRIVIVSEQRDEEAVAAMLDAGADNYIIKPVREAQLKACVRAAFRIKRLYREEAKQAQSLVSAIQQTTEELSQVRRNNLALEDTLFAALTGYACVRDADEHEHLQRVGRCAHWLARAASQDGFFRDVIDESFQIRLGRCAPLHDIGKAGLPDHLLLKPSCVLTAEEEMLIETHTSIGVELIRPYLEGLPGGNDDFQMVVDIIRHHHERFDGSGSPEGLKGEEIPLAARIVGLVDAYDSLRSRRLGKPGLTHEAVLQVLKGRSQHFDPDLFATLLRRADEFRVVYEPFTAAARKDGSPIGGTSFTGRF